MPTLTNYRKTQEIPLPFGNMKRWAESLEATISTFLLGILFRKVK